MRNLYDWCDICNGGNGYRTTKDGRSVLRRLAQDHDHETGRKRGLLCTRCNLMLGHAMDNPHNLRAAAEYLEMHDYLAAVEAHDWSADRAEYLRDKAALDESRRGVL